MKTIDTKSLLIGLLFGVCILLALGAAGEKQGDVGRYQVASPDINTCFVIDTATGQVWRKMASSRGGKSFATPDEWKTDSYSGRERPRQDADKFLQP